MSAQDNEALVRRFFEEVWAKGNVAAVDEFMAADYVEHTEHAVPPGARPGRDSVKQRIALYYEALPDWKVTIHDLFGRGDRVAYRWSASGTHLGEWAGLSPTGLHMRAGGITILRIAEGRFVEGWASLDISRSEEERRWLSEGGKTDEAYLERVANQPSAGIVPPHSSVTEAFARSLTWRLRAAEARERERIEQELRVARRIHWIGAACGLSSPTVYFLMSSSLAGWRVVGGSWLVIDGSFHGCRLMIGCRPPYATERSHRGLVQRFAKPPCGVTCIEGSKSLPLRQTVRPGIVRP